jgi:teichuronic acid exporter
VTSFSSATVWSTLNAAASVLLPMLVFAFFAHIVPVSEVGVIAVGLAWIEMIKVFTPQGFYEQLISHRSDHDTHESVLAVLLFSSIASYFIYLPIIWLSGLWRQGDPQLFPALSLLGVKLVCDVVVLQPQAMLVQELKLRRIALRVVWANLGAGATGALIALRSPLFGLVGYYVCQTLLVLIMTTISPDRVAWPRLRPALLRPLVRNAGYASGVRLVAAMNNYFDQILLSNFVTIGRLAQYNVAKRVETTLITGSSAFQGVLYQPLFSATSAGGREALLRRCIRTLNILFGVPVIVFALNSGLIVTTVFGRQWAPAAGLAAIMALSGLARAYGSIHGALLSVTQRNRGQMAVTFVSCATWVAAVLAVHKQGLAVVALTLLARNVLVSLMFARLTRNDMSQPLLRYTTDCFAPLAMLAAIGWASSWAVRLAVGPRGAAAWEAFGVCGLSVVAAALFTFRSEISAVLAERLAGRRQVAEAAAPCA